MTTPLEFQRRVRHDGNQQRDNRYVTPAEINAIHAAWQLSGHWADLDNEIHSNIFTGGMRSSLPHGNLIHIEQVRRLSGKVLYELVALLNVYGISLQDVIEDMTPVEPDQPMTQLPRKRYPRRLPEDMPPRNDDGDGDQESFL